MAGNEGDLSMEDGKFTRWNKTFEFTGRVPDKPDTGTSTDYSLPGISWSKLLGNYPGKKIKVTVEVMSEM